MSRAALGILLPLALTYGGSAAPARDLDVGVPPGSPLDWGQAFPARLAPLRSPLAWDAAEVGAGELPRGSRALVARLAPVRPRVTSSRHLLEILTWDITGHLPWVQTPRPQAAGPRSGTSSLRPELPTQGEPLYWAALAPLLRLLLHPGQVSELALKAHLLELGDPCRSALAAAALEESLTEFVDDVERRLAPAREVASAAPRELPPALQSRRQRMLLRFASAELLRQEPYDPVGSFGERLFLFPEEFGPAVRHLATAAGDIEVRRNAVSALARYPTSEAQHALAQIAAAAVDQVVLVRALAGLGRFGIPLEEPARVALAARFTRATDGVERVALLGALGRVGAVEAMDPLLALAQGALDASDSDTLRAVLLALFGMPERGGPWQAQLEAFLEQLELRVRTRGERFTGRPTVKTALPDRREGRFVRAATLGQLVTVLRCHRNPGERANVAALLELIGGAGKLDSIADHRSLALLDRIEPVVQRRFLETLARLGDPAADRLLSALGRAHAHDLRGGWAHGLVPREERGELAQALLEGDVAARLVGLDVLLRDAHPAAGRTCRALVLEIADRERLPDSAAERTLFRRALGEASRRRILSLPNCLRLLRRVRAELAREHPLIDELRARTRALVRAVDRSGNPRELVRVYLDDLERLGVLEPSERHALRGGVLKRLAGLDVRAPDGGYRVAVETEVLALVLGRPVAELARNLTPGRFEPPVALADDVVLALGRVASPAAVELLLGLLRTEHRSLHAPACIALGMTGRETARAGLVQALGSEEPFTRFAAAEALLRRGLDVEFTDWLFAGRTQLSEGRERFLRALDAEDGER